jgi:hypothetical protein
MRAAELKYTLLANPCFASAERDFHHHIQKASWPRFYTENWALLLILVLGAPLLPYLAASIVFWMYRGFS